MSTPEDLGATAREIIDANLYMTLGTADEAGRPWASPVYYAVREYSEFFWVSLPDARHSRNLASRPEVSIVVFDSHQPIGTGQAVYMSAQAEEVAGAELAQAVEVFSRRGEMHGGRGWTVEDVQGPAPHRLYRATANQHWMLDKAARPGDRRTPVTPRPS